MGRMIAICLSFLLLVACGPRYGDFFPCHDDGTVKPKVVLLPMSDATKNPERAQELMSGIRFKLMDRGEVFVYSEESVKKQMERMGASSFFNPDISFAKYFGGSDFIVATELVDYSYDQYGNVDDRCMPPHLQRKNLLTLKLRVRMIDMRGQEPCIVMQEILTRHLLVPQNCNPLDPAYFYELSSRLTEDFVMRLEGISWSLR